MTNEDGSDSDSEPAVPKPGAAKHLYDAKKHMCVPDMRSLCHLPADADEGALMTFRAFIFSLDHTLHVPDEPGCYVAATQPPEIGACRTPSRSCTT